MNKIMEKVSEDLSASIKEALPKLKVEPEKKGVNLLDITKKLSSKKFKGSK